MTSNTQYDDLSPTLNSDAEDGRRKKTQKSTSRRLANLKDKVFTSISRPNDSSDSEANRELPFGNQSNQKDTEISGAIKADQGDGLPSQQRPQRTTQKSIPIVLKPDVQKELRLVMDDPPPVPAKNHARPQVQHKLDKKRELQTQNTSSQGRRMNQVENLITQLQEELKKAKEDVSQAEGEVLKEREIRENLRTQLDDLISQNEGQNQDADKLNQENLLLSKELSRAHDSLNRDQLYQTLISERRSREKEEKLWKAKVNLLRQDMETVKIEAKKLIQGLQSDVNEAREELQRRVQESDEKVTQIQEQRDQVTSDRDRVRRELDRVVQQAASQTSLDVYHFDDKYFQSQFSILRGNIKDWAHRAFSNGQFTSDRRINLRAEKVFDSISSHWETYMYSDENRSTIVQAFVWTYLIAKIFGGRTWESPNAAQPFGRLLDKYLEPSENSPENLQLYHEWRSTGARLAVPRGTEQSALDYSSALLKATAETLHAYLEPWSTMGKTQSISMLSKIIKEAVQLDLKMQQQRASFVLWGATELRKQNGGLYDAGAMEVRYGKVPEAGRREKDRFVEVVIAPLLLKRGTSDGRDYSVSVVVEKAQVDIAVPPKKHKGLLNMVR